MSLNNCAPKSGRFINDASALWSSIGGPGFTILQALLCLLFTWTTKSIYAYAAAFFAVFTRFFSIVFGGIDLQDEAGMARLLNVNKYLVAAVVLAILFLILWRCNRVMKLNMKAIGYFTVLATLSVLLVIEVNKLITIN